MKPSVAQAKETLQTHIKAYQPTRAAWDTLWTLSIALDSGRHWCYPTTANGQITLRKLNTIVDPNRDDVRVTMNLIHAHVREHMGITTPAKVSGFAQPRSGASEDRIVAELSTNILDNWLEDADGLRVLREKERIRYVLGTAIVRRWVAAHGAPGNIRSFKYGWSHVYPWEIIRDPAATSLRPDRDEEFFCHEKPRTTAWVERNYGVKIETETTLGRLLDYQNQVHAASGLGNVSAYDSKTPAVMVYEPYFRDSDPSAPQEWAWTMPCYRDPYAAGDEVIPLMKQGVIANPFAGLPFHFFTADQNVQAMWGFGIPIALREAQDLVNLAWTTVLRYQVTAQGKWLVQEGTLEKPSRSLSNRIDEPIIWKRSGQYDAPPSRIVPPQPSPVTGDLLSRAPEWMQRLTNTSDVLRGITSKRGESGEAVEAKLRAASSTIEANIQADDDIEYARLLNGTLRDITHKARFGLDDAKRWLGPDVPDEQVYLLLRKPVSERVKAITLVSGDVHPKTPKEQQQNVVALAGAQIIDAEMAQWALIQQGSTDVNPLMAGSYRDQTSEIEAMKAGQDVQVSAGEEHAYHLRTIGLLINSPAWHTLTPDVRQRVMEHWTAHKVGQLKDAQFDQQLQASVQPEPQQPSPPAAAMEALGGTNAGGVAPAGINAA